MAEEVKTISSPFLSPTELIKQRSVTLLFDCINLNSKSINEEDKYAFQCKVKDLSVMLERYTPSVNRKEIKEWYDQMTTEISAIANQKDTTPSDKSRSVLEKKYRYALEVHEHNQRILMNSPIVEIEAEGELDITDDDAMKMIRGGKRTDDKRIIS